MEKTRGVFFFFLCDENTKHTHTHKHTGLCSSHNHTGVQLLFAPALLSCPTCEFVVFNFSSVGSQARADPDAAGPREPDPARRRWGHPPGRSAAGGCPGGGGGVGYGGGGGRRGRWASSVRPGAVPADRPPSCGVFFRFGCVAVFCDNKISWNQVPLVIYRLWIPFFDARPEVQAGQFDIL